MSLPRLWAFLAVALPTLGALIAGLQSVDLAYQLRAGAEILDARAIPTIDSWTFTAAGLPWTDQQWGAQVILTTVFRAGGWTGLVLLRAGLVSVIFACLFEIGRRRGLGLRRSAWLVLTAFVVSLVALALRPQLLGMAIFAIVLLLVADRRAHPLRLWAVPILILVWANLHGSFFLGPLVLGLAWLADLHDRVERPHQVLLVGVVAALAACITPFGPAVWAYAIGLSANAEVTRLITEWQPTSVTEPSGLLFFASAIGVAALIARRRLALGWPALIWFGAFFVIGVYAARGIAWWSLAAVVVVADALVVAPALAPTPVVEAAVRRPEPSGTRSMRRLNVVVAALIVLAGVALLPAWRPVDPGLEAPQGVLANAPSGITAGLRGLARPGDRVFNPQPWGSWFEFALPNLTFAVDSRIELFPGSVWSAYEGVSAGADGWQQQLVDWGVTIVVVQPADTALTTRLSAAGWRTAYSDEDGSILLIPGSTAAASHGRQPVPYHLD